MFKTEKDPELFIALVGRLGTDTRSISDDLSATLKKYNYNSTTIQVSELLSDAFPDEEIPKGESEKRIEKLIELGNQYRKKNGQQNALSILSMVKIASIRNEITGNQGEPAPRHAYIINQLKRPEEVELLRRVYGERFVLVSCHSSEKRRLEVLFNKFQADHPENIDTEKWQRKAQDLIRKDENESDNNWGQRVSDAFPMADIFLNTDKSYTKLLERFIDGLFGDTSIAPTSNEHFAHLATVSALRSNDLSRQVGAVIVSSRGELLSSGCNEVPSAGGGVYTPEGLVDERDLAKGVDYNSVMKKYLILDLITKLRQNDWIYKEKSKVSDIDIVKNLIDKKSGFLSDAAIMSGTEFGRAVHAEMAAITEAARFGRSLEGATLYCTTFPCHNCAKHIVSAGISIVYYQEPYIKSKAIELYPNTISLDKSENGLVDFRQFDGVGTRMYRRIFSKSKRKDSAGKYIKFDPEKADPIISTIGDNYIVRESVVIAPEDSV